MSLKCLGALVNAATSHVEALWKRLARVVWVNVVVG